MSGQTQKTAATSGPSGRSPCASRKSLPMSERQQMALVMQMCATDSGKCLIKYSYKYSRIMSLLSARVMQLKNILQAGDLYSCSWVPTSATSNACLSISKPELCLNNVFEEIQRHSYKEVPAKQINWCYCFAIESNCVFFWRDREMAALFKTSARRSAWKQK